MREELYDSEDAEPADAAAAREFHLEALREVCDVFAEALTPKQRAEPFGCAQDRLASVCTLEPCCRAAASWFAEEAGRLSRWSDRCIGRADSSA